MSTVSRVQHHSRLASGRVGRLLVSSLAPTGQVLTKLASDACDQGIYNIQLQYTIYNYNIHGFKPTFDSLYALTLIKFSGWVNSNTHLLDTTLLVCTKET